MTKGHLMTDVSKATAKAIFDELVPIIEETLSRHGLAMPKIKTKYGVEFEMKISSSSLEEGVHGINLGSREVAYYKAFGHPGLNAPIGTVFTHKGEEYAFAGIAASRRKFPIYAKNLHSGLFHFFPDGIIPAINAAALAAV